MRSARLAPVVLLAAAAWACTPRPTDGRFACDPLDPGACPAGWVCQRRGGQVEHRCYGSPGGYCGDGVVDPGEVCDGPAVPDTCRSLGHFGGATRCTADCGIADASGCFPAVELTCGTWHCCALDPAGRPYCWGSGQWLIEHAPPPDFAPVAGPGSPALVSLAVGNGFTCGLDAGGDAWCWGVNDSGQLGVGHRQGAYAPEWVRGGPFRALVAGPQHACALDLDDRAHCWGSNQALQLGHGSTDGDEGVVVPGPVDTDRRFVALALGNTVSCGLSPEGEIHCWGLNSRGEVGDGTLEPRARPTPVAGGLRFQALGAGTYHACGVTVDGPPACWGWHHGPEPVVLPTDARLVALSGGLSSTCGLDGDGTAWCWGDGPVGLPEGSSASPVAIPASDVYRRVTSGASFACGLTRAGRIACWGWNGAGGLGRGAARSRPSPVPLAGPLATLVAGFLDTCGLTAAGEAWCWGNNEHGNLGDGTEWLRYRPQVLPGVPALRELLVSRVFSCGLDVDAGLWCWGRTVADEPSRPAPEQAGRRFLAATAGQEHLCAVDEAGAAWCWGGNGAGQLGTGDLESHWEEPAPVLGEIAFRRLASAAFTTCGVDDHGRAFCWGSNRSGQVGPSLAWAVTTPLELTFGTRAAIRQVIPGEYHACALDADGQAWCWGNGTYGELGDGTGRGHADPGPVAQTLGFVELAVGGAHACGLTGEGTVWCWGVNAHGQLGDGTLANRFAPVRVEADQRFAAVAAGSSHTCALDTEGGVHCWGANEVGQLASDDYFVTPVEVDPPRDAMP
jgi:alpha-tubulin suppressor-like RCC1 family protein